MKKSERTAVLIHGCHLQADLGGKPWEDIVWGGSEPTLEGRGTMGLKVALERGADFVIFSTGASEKDHLLEGEYTYEYAKKHADKIARAIGVSTQRLKLFLRHHTSVDIQSQNTRDECERNLRFCADSGVTQILLVSSSWHIPRCHMEAVKVANEMRRNGEFVPDILAVASHDEPQGVVIFEPPHRGDRPKTRFHLILPRLFKLPTHQTEQAAEKLDAVLRGYGV